LYFLASFINL